MNVDSPVLASAPPAPGNTGPRRAENADPDNGFSLDLADQDQQPAPADDPADTAQTENTAEDMARVLQSPGVNVAAAVVFLGADGIAPTERLAPDLAPQTQSAEPRAIATDRPAPNAEKTPIIPAAPAPGEPAAQVLTAKSTDQRRPVGNAPAEHVAAAPLLALGPATAPKFTPHNAPPPQGSPAVGLSQISPQTRPTWMARTPPAAPAAIAVPRLGQPEEGGRHADAASAHQTETRLPPTAPVTAQSAITIAAPNPADPALSAAAFTADAGQLPGLALGPVSGLFSGEASQFGPAPPAGQPATTAPGPPVAAMHAIAQAAIALQNRPVELMLHPEELGRVRLTLQAHDGSMAVAISVERPETLDLLRRHIDQLANQLRDLGYQNLTFDFAAQDQNFGDRDQEMADTYQQADEQFPPPTQPPEPLQLLIGPDAGVDIRV